MKKIKIKNLELGTGKPKIAISITQNSINGIKSELIKISKIKVDLVEWRIDDLNSIPNEAEIKEINQLINKILPEVPIIATFRTPQEGGNHEITDEQYVRLLSTVSKFNFDIIDLEISHDNAVVKKLVQEIHNNKHLIIGSFHNFKATPSKDEITQLFQKMVATNVDIAKMAVMPNDKLDVLNFINTTYQISKKLPIPMVSMAMGKLGSITRLCGELNNSIITFGSLNTNVSSAPGQIPVPILRTIINLL